MLIQNVHVDNQKDAVDVRIEDGKFAAIKPGLIAKPGEEVIDGQGKVLLPPFIDSHVHLDATLTAGQPEWNENRYLVRRDSHLVRTQKGSHHSRRQAAG